MLLWVAYMLGPVIVGASLARSDELRLTIYRSLATAAAILSVIAIAEFVRGEAFLPPVDNVVQYTRSGHIRAYAGWQHPLALGMYLSMATFLIVTWKGSAPIKLVGSSLCFLGVLATQQRSPLLGLAAGAIFLVLVRPGLAGRIKAAISMSLLAALFLTTQHSSVQAYRSFLFESLTPGSEASGTVTYRSILLEVGLRRVEEAPLLGYGFGSVTNGKTELLTFGQLRLTDVANTPLAMALETGLVGLLCLTLIIGAAVGRLWLTRGTTEWSPYVASAIVACTTTSLGVMTTPSLALLLFLVGACYTANRGGDLKATVTGSVTSHRTTEVGPV
jgi:hypothetical protein